ncbi:trypsin-like peptidase domain-containing protein [Leuconostocaceae bacterium ESL0958]|nr:trypsin-like peptidase domain-containing protein [Leuconostocaceae bacterium ESL0958]
MKKSWLLATLLALVMGAVIVLVGLNPNSLYSSRLAKQVPTNAVGTATVQKTAYVSHDQAIQAYNNVKDSVVTVQNLKQTASLSDGINAFDQQNKDNSQQNYETAAQGSGLVVRVNQDSTDIVTNNHVVKNSSMVQVVAQNGQKLSAKIIKADAANDLALLRVKKDPAVSKAAQLADSENLKAGASVMAVGSPLGVAYASTMTSGIISAPSRYVTLSETNGQPVRVVQTDTAINPGNSGGPLIDLQGHVIGITSAKISAGAANTNIEGLGFALPAESVRQFIK